MMFKTYLTLGIAVAFYFLPHVENKILFLFVVIASTLLPGAGVLLSTKRHKLFIGPKNKGIIGRAYRSYTFVFIVSVFLAFFYPRFALPFFLGFSFHLFLETFSVEGITPYWPYMKTTKGKISHGGSVDSALFVVFLILDFIFLINLFFGY